MKLHEINESTYTNLFGNAPVTCYKHTKYQGKKHTTIPGYCCADITQHGLAYIHILGLTDPLYTFKIKHLAPWPDDDITGNMLDPADIPIIHKLQQQYKPTEIHSMVTGKTKPPENIHPIILIRAYLPGWIWTPKIVTGNPGESIVNAPVTMTLCDGIQLSQIIKQVTNEPHPSYTIKQLFQQLQSNGATYDLNSIAKDLGL